MKILHLLNELKRSGAEVMLQAAFDKFKSSGIESHILSTGASVGEYAAILKSTGYTIHHIPFRKNPLFFVQVGRLLRKEDFNVIHIHTERSFFWYVVLAKLCNVTTVVRTFHNVFLFSSYLRWKRQLQRTLSSKVFGARHTAIGDSVLAVERERFHNDCVLIPNWTDVNRFRPPSPKERTEARRLYGLGPNDFVIVTVGECSAVKNHMDVLSAVKRAKRFIGAKIVLLHVGTGPLLEQEALFVQHQSLQDDCRFVGPLSDVRPCLHAADIYVMTSRHEGLAIAALEAMSAGLPAILYDVRGIRDLLQDGRGGLLIKPDEDCLVEALLRMSQNHELRQIYAREAREKVVRTYSLENNVKKLICLYLGVQEQAPAGRDPSELRAEIQCFTRGASTDTPDNWAE